MKSAGLKAGATQATRVSASVTPTHYNIDVAFEPETHFLRATAAVTLRVNEPTSAIEFELNRHLTLRSVTDAQGRSLEFIRSGRLNSHKLVVRLAEPAAAEATLTLSFAYDGALPPGPLDYITAEGILLRDESRWYPATDLAGFTVNSMNIELPYGWKVVASGQADEPAEERPLVSSRSIVAFPWTLQRCTDTYFSSPHGPLASFAMHSCFAYGRDMAAAEKAVKELVSKPGEKITMSGDLGQGTEFETQVADAAFDQLSFVSGAMTAPPAPRLSIVQAFPSQRGITGYSGPAFLVVSEDAVKWHGYPGFAPSFLPHEIAHQWFPIEVTLASEEDGWLAESLAEYLAWRYLEEKQPDDARRMVELAMRNTLAYEPARPLRLGLKLFALEDWDVTHATLYQRGMLVWRTLETVIDRERVDAALREYYRRHRGGPASIADFRKICEEISGRDLGWFFDYYINGTELPEISLRRLPSAAPNELAGEILVRNAPPEFQVRVELRVTTAGGVINHSVATRGEVTPFAIDVRDAVTAVALDPRLCILRVTEPARRHRAQQLTTLLQDPITDGTDSIVVVNAFQAAIDLDPENLAGNHQYYSSLIAWTQFSREEYDAAWKMLDRVVALDSLDPMATDFLRAWARVYRARIALARDDKALARREVEAGLAMKCPALEMQFTPPEARAKQTTAAEALKEVLAKL